MKIETRLFTLDEILNFEEDGTWFYGLVKFDDGIKLQEIFPGHGCGDVFVGQEEDDEKSPEEHFEDLLNTIMKDLYED